MRSLVYEIFFLRHIVSCISRLDTNNNGTGIAYHDFHLLMLHSFVRLEVVSTSRDTVLPILTLFLQGVNCDVPVLNSQKNVNLSCILGNLDHDFNYLY